MNLQKLIFTENECYKVGQKFTPKKIMVHSTGANNPKLSRYVGPDDGKLGVNKYDNHWNHLHPGGKDVGPHSYADKNKDGRCDICGGRRACVHAFIGKLKDGTVATYQTLPWDVRGWHAGGSANDTHVGFEICEDGLKDAAYFKAVYREAVELCAYLCTLYGLTEKDIICHSEGHKLGVASDHGDVMHWFPKHGKSMDTLRADVKALLATTEKETSGTLYRVQVGAFSKKIYAEEYLAKVKAAGFTNAYITEEKRQAEAPAKPEPVKQIAVGSTVRIKQGAKTYDGKTLKDYVYNRNHKVLQLKGDRAVITYNGDVVAAVKASDLVLV